MFLAPGRFRSPWGPHCPGTADTVDFSPHTAVMNIYHRELCGYRCEIGADDDSFTSHKIALHAIASLASSNFTLAISGAESCHKR